MGTRDDRPSLSELTNALYDERAWIRKEAREALAGIGPEAFDALFELADGNVMKVVRDVGETLAAMHGASVADRLLAKLTDEDESIQECAAKLLGAFKDRRVVEPLTDSLERASDSSVREAAATALARIGQTGCINALVRALGDEDEGVRSTASAALVRVGQRGVDGIVTTLKKGNARARYRAATVLADGSLGDHGTFEPLLAALSDKEPGVRHMAALALGGSAERRAVDPLIELLKDGDTSVRLAAAGSLQKIIDATKLREKELSSARDTRKQALEELLADLDGKDLQRGYDAALVLGWCGAEEAVEPLAEILADRHKEDLHGRAIEALGRIGNQRCLELLVGIAGSPGDWEVRRHAVRALGRMKDERAVAVVTEALRDEDDLVADAAWEVLEYRGALPPEEPRPSDTSGEAPVVERPDDSDGDETEPSEREDAAPSPARDDSEFQVFVNAWRRRPSLPWMLVGLAVIAAGTTQLHHWKTSLGLGLEKWYYWISVALLSAVGFAFVLSMLVGIRETCARWIGRGAGFARLGGFTFCAGLLWLTDWSIGVGVVDGYHSLSRQYFQVNPYAKPMMISALAVESFIAVLGLYSFVAWLRRPTAGAAGAKLVVRQVLLLAVAAVCLAGFVVNLRRQIQRESLLPQLQNGTAAERAAAADGVGEFGLGRAFDGLVAMLEDPDPVLREKATRALGKLKDRDAVEPLAARLLDGVPAVRSAAVTALKSLDRPVARHLLKRGNARGPNESWPPREACDLLLESMPHDDPAIREASVVLLAEMKEPRALDGIIARIRDRWPSVRIPAVRALGEFKDPRATEPLVACLADGHWADVKEIPKALVKIGDPRAAALLFPLLKSKKGFVRDCALEALSGLPLDPAEALAPLLEALDDYPRRQGAAKALTHLGEAAVEPLVARLGSFSTPSLLVEALEQITGAKNMSSDPDAWKKWLAERK